MSATETTAIVDDCRTDDDGLSHWLCCLAPGPVVPTLCGTTSLDGGDGVDDVDIDCVVCCDLRNTNFCPVYGRCSFEAAS